MKVACLSCRRPIVVTPAPIGNIVPVQCSCGCSMLLETTLDDTKVLTRDSLPNDWQNDGDINLLEGPFVSVGRFYLPEEDQPQNEPFERSNSGAEWLIKKHKSLPPDQQIKNLRKALSNMEQRQEFEDCALIRDLLKELENW